MQDLHLSIIAIELMSSAWICVHVAYRFVHVDVFLFKGTFSIDFDPNKLKSSSFWALLFYLPLYFMSIFHCRSQLIGWGYCPSITIQNTEDTSGIHR